MFFEKQDYETFDSKHYRLNDSVIRQRRKDVKEKLLELHRDIITDYIWNQYGLYAHWKQDHITSADYPMELNKYRVDWLGLRYGRSKNEIDLLNVGLGIRSRDPQDTLFGFQKYNNFELAVYGNCLSMGLFHSTRNDGVDRMYISQLINDNDTNFLEKLKTALQNLKGYGYILKADYIDSQDNYQRVCFYIDEHYPETILEDFITFYKQYCKDGYVNTIMKDYPIKDKRIQTKEGIIAEFFDNIDHLMEIYHILSWKPKNA